MVDRYCLRSQRLDELAALDPFEYERQWKIAAKQLGVRPSVMEANEIRLQLHALAGAQSRSGDGAGRRAQF
jgi:hypothetical protein